MSKRKIIRLAEKTFVVSLPSSFVSSHHLDKGDELDCIQDGAVLSFSTCTANSAKRSIDLDASGLSERVLRWQVSSYHKQGFDEIVVQNYAPEQFEVITDLVNNLFIGFIIKEKSSLRIVVGSVAVVDAGEFDATLRRSFRQMLIMFEETTLAFKENDVTLLHAQVDAEHMNNKLTNFCERLLNQSLSTKKKGHFWYVIAWNLEKIADNLKYLANHYTDSCKVSDESVALLERVSAYVKGYYDVTYDFSFKHLTELSHIKKQLEADLYEQLLSADKDDVILLHYLHIIVLQTADFSASLIALNTEC